MSKESLPTPEISKDTVIAAYRKLVERGFKTPHGLDPEDPDVIEAERLFDAWDEQESQDPNKYHRHNFEKTKLFVDAGFDDPEYLDEILNNHRTDAVDLDKDSSDSALVQLRNEYAQELLKMRKMLGKTDLE